MKRTVSIVAVVLLSLLLCGAAAARLTVSQPSGRMPGTEHRWPTTIWWFDDIESGVNGWTHGDATASSTPHFHVSTFNPYAGGGTYNWYCGDETLTADGGYANSWDDRLDLPSVDWTGSTFPIWTFAYRYDSEVDYDFTYVQAESLGVWADLNRGYNGSSGGWQDLGLYGFQLAAYDNPLVARYRFVSDGAWSDGDGDGDTDGGAFAVDNIKIFDFITSTVYFLDDVEDGTGLCTPSIPAAAGDWWYIADQVCPAASDPHSWHCGDPADTNLVPPNLMNWIQTPYVDISTAVTCTFKFWEHSGVPTVDNDYYTEWVTTDGGTSWYQTGAWWGDFEQCDGWGTSGIVGTSMDAYLPGTLGAFLTYFFTTDNGCGPAVNGPAGIYIDDCSFEGVDEVAVQNRTWGSIKAMYR